jgi:hypothetical protein
MDRARDGEVDVTAAQRRDQLEIGALRDGQLDLRMMGGRPRDQRCEIAAERAPRNATDT